MHPQQNTYPELRRTAGLLNLLPQIGHYFFFFSFTGASTEVSSLLLLPFFSSEKEQEAILWATRMKKSPGDLRKLMIGKGLGLACSMQVNYVPAARYRRLQNLASVSIKYRNFMTVDNTLRRQKQRGNTFKQTLAPKLKPIPLSCLYLRRLNFCSNFRLKQGPTTQMRTSNRIVNLVRGLVRSRPQKFSAQRPLCLRRKQISLRAEMKVAISWEKYLSDTSVWLALRNDLTMYSMPAWMYSWSISISMNSQKWILGSAIMLSMAIFIYIIHHSNTITSTSPTHLLQSTLFQTISMADPNLYARQPPEKQEEQYGAVDSYHNMYAQAGTHNEPAIPTTTTSNNPQLTTNGVCKKFIHGKCKQGDCCPHPHDKSKIKACEKFENNNFCPYGERCNFSHDLKICLDFVKKKCERGEHCPYRHVYKSCPNFDMGFCLRGNFCQQKHIVRKLCWDYMYGYCEKGSKCPDHHPKIFVEDDFKYTKILYEKLSKSPLEVIICRSCKVIGHKVNKCPKRVEIQPKDAFKCGLCGSTHEYIEDCNYLR